MVRRRGIFGEWRCADRRGCAAAYLKARLELGLSLCDDCNVSTLAKELARCDAYVRGAIGNLEDAGAGVGAVHLEVARALYAARVVEDGPAAGVAKES